MYIGFKSGWILKSGIFPTFLCIRIDGYPELVPGLRSTSVGVNSLLLAMKFFLPRVGLVKGHLILKIFFELIRYFPVPGFLRRV